MLGAVQCAGFAELGDSERAIRVRLERKIRKQFTQRETRSESLSHDKAHPAPLSEAGGRGQGDAQRGSVAAGDGPITQAANGTRGRD